MRALKRHSSCPNAATPEKAGSGFCDTCPFRRQPHEFLAEYGPTMTFMDSRYVFCGFDPKDMKLPKGVKIHSSGKSSKKTLWINAEDLPLCRRSFQIPAYN